jgi:hypothetical protein
MLALLASYASAIYLFLLNTFASFWLSRACTSTSENVTELGFGPVNVVEVVKGTKIINYNDSYLQVPCLQLVNCGVVPTQTLGTEKVAVLPSQESDITDHTGLS